MFKRLLLVLLSGKESPEEDKDTEENAALKIQAAFRGHLAREEVKKMKSSDLEEEKTEENEWGDWLYPHRKQEKNPNPSTLLWLSFFLSKWYLMSWNNICCCCEKSVVSICLINMPLNTCLLKISLISWVLFILLPSVCLEALGFRVPKLDLECLA